MTWSVRGIDDEVRETALAAARRSGKPVGEWLNAVIRESAGAQTAPRDEAEPVSEPVPPPAAAALSGARIGDGDVARLERGLAALTARLERLGVAHAAATASAVPPAPGRRARVADASELAALADALKDRLDRIAGLPRPADPPARAAARPSDHRSSELRPADARTSEVRPSDLRAADARPVSRPAEPQPARRDAANPVFAAPRPVDRDRGFRDRFDGGDGAFVPDAGPDDRLSDVIEMLAGLDRRLSDLAAQQGRAVADKTVADRALVDRTVAADRAERPDRSAAPGPQTVAEPAEAGGDVDDFTRAVAAIGRRQQALEPGRPAGPALRPAARPALASDIERHFKELSGRLDRIAAPEHGRDRDEKLGGELRALRSAVEDGFARRLTPLSDGLAEVRTAVDRLEQEVTRGRHDERLASVLDGLAALRDELAGLQRPDPAPAAALRDLGRSQGDILDRLEQLHRTATDRDVVADLHAEIAELRHQLDARPVAEGLGALESRLVALGRRIDQLVAGRGESFAALDEIRRALAGQRTTLDFGPLESRFDALDERLSGLGAVEAGIARLADRLDAIERDGVGGPALVATLAEEIAGLAARLDALHDRPIVAAAADVVAPAAEERALLEAVADRLEAALERLDRLDAPVPPSVAAAGGADAAIIAAIDDKFAQIARQLDTAEDRFASLGAIEDTLVEMHAVLSGREQAAGVGADDAAVVARAAVAEFIRHTQDDGAAAALADLAAELGGLKAQTEGLETRTADGLRAVQEALASVAGLLQQSRAAEAVRPARASREEARPLEPGSGKPAPSRPDPMTAEAATPSPVTPSPAAQAPAPALASPAVPVVAAAAEEAPTEPLAADAAASRRADFIAAARRAALAAQAVRAGEPQPAVDGSDDDEPRRGTLARIGAALKGRTRPVVTIVAVLLLAGIATEISLNGLERLRSGFDRLATPITALVPNRAVDPIETASVPASKLSPPPLSSDAPAAPGPLATAPASADPLAVAAPRSVVAPATPPSATALPPADVFAAPVAPATGFERSATAPAAGFVAEPAAPRSAGSSSAAPLSAAPLSAGPLSAAPLSAGPLSAAPATTAPSVVAVAPPPVAAVPDAAVGAPAEVRPTYPLPEEKIGSLALRDAAARGDARAAFEVGQRYAEGHGVAVNGLAAVEWFRRSAEAGFVPAQYRLASGLEKGLAGTRDLAEAKRWYAAAAGKGNVRAMHNLGVLYANDRDMTNALPWFQKAADAGLKDSQFNLGIIHALGSGVKQDLAVSYKWFALAAGQGDGEAGKKRDEIAQYLDKTTLASAKLAVDTWRAKPVDRVANDETNPWTEAVVGDKPLEAAGERIARVQTLLKTQGVYAGPVDGVANADLKAAVKAFQRKAGLKPTGEVDDALVRALTIKTTAAAKAI
jgi:localization factor PodJL